MNKQPRITEQTRNNFIEAFWELYEKNGIGGVTVKAATESAGYNRSTFYKYFLDVYDLLEQVEAGLLADLEGLIGKVLPELSIERGIEAFADFYGSNSKYIRVLLGPKGDPYFVLQMKKTVRPIIYRILDIKEDDLRAEYVSEFVMSAMIGLISHWFERDNDISYEELVSLVFPIIHKGVLPLLREES